MPNTLIEFICINGAVFLVLGPILVAGYIVYRFYTVGREEGKSRKMLLVIVPITIMSMTKKEQMFLMLLIMLIGIYFLFFLHPSLAVAILYACGQIVVIAILVRLFLWWLSM